MRIGRNTGWGRMFSRLAGRKPVARRRAGRRPAWAAETLELRVLLSATVAPDDGEEDQHADDAALGSGSAIDPFAFSLLAGSSSSASWSDPDSQQLDLLSISVKTEHKPQSKVWQHAGYWWAALSDGSGTQVYRLDGTKWTQVATASSTKGNTDVKQSGDLVYVLIEKDSSSKLATLRYVPGSPGGYERLQESAVPLPSNIETATIDIDSTGRMWVAYDSGGKIEVKYSDGPYTSWSSAITLESNAQSDDISVVFAMPNGRIGVLWSNQNSERFGFRTHVDGTSPTTWTADEVPAGSSAVNNGAGMADDHLNVAVASDGTVYAAIKTGYTSSSLTTIGLLIRRPNGQWDPLYTVETSGTRPIVQLDEAAGLLLVFYRNTDSDGPIVYRYTSTSSISFSSKQTLLSESDPNDPTGSKENFNGELLVLASGGGNAVGRLLNFGPAANSPPSVFAGNDAAVVFPQQAALDGTVTDDNLPDGSAVATTWSVASSPGGSTVTFGNRFAVDTTATFSQTGTYVLRLTASDGELSAFDDVTITVDQSAPPANNPPVAQNDAYSVSQGGTLSVTAANGVLSNDTDADLDPLAAALATGPAHGTLTLNADGSFIYQPTDGYAGSDSFTYRADDGQANSNAATVTINVTSSSSSVIATFQQGLNGYSGARDTQLMAGSPSTNFGAVQEFSVDGNPDSAVLLGWNLSSIPAGSTVVSASITLDITNKSSDTYELYELLRAWEEQSATWQQAAAGSNWSAAGAQDATDRATTVLGQLTGSTGLKTFELNAAGLAVIQKWINNSATNHGFIAQDYDGASNGLDFASREASSVADRPLLTIVYQGPSGPPNEPPVADDVDTSTQEDNPVNVTLSGSDPEGSSLTFAVLTGPMHGWLSGSGASRTYTPDEDYFGPDSFTYRSNDGTNNSQPATVSIDVTPVNDAPTNIALSNDTVDEDADTSSPVPVGTLSAVDVDPGDSHTYQLVSGSGGDDNAAFQIAGDQLQVKAGTSLDFDAQSEYSIHVRADDGSATFDKVFTINVVPHNDAPTDISLSPNSIDENVDTSSAVAVGTLSTSDPDAGDVHSYRLVSGDGDDDNSRFRIVGDQLQIVAGTGIDFETQRSYSVRVEVSDGIDTFRESLSIGVNDRNDAPVAAGESYGATLDQLLSVSAADGVLQNDNDQDGNPLTAVLQQTTADGTLDLAADGSFTYQPNPGFTGGDSFTYRASDGTAESATVTVTINVFDTSTPVTVSLQQGLNGYDGARDAHIREEKPTRNYGSETEVDVDGVPDISALLGWDLSSIPAGSTIVSAGIRLNVTNSSSQTYEIYELLRAWDEQSVTWQQSAAGSNWSTAGAQAASDRGSTVLGQITGSEGLTTFELNAAGLAVIQKWMNDPSSNHGFIAQDYDASNRFGFSSREASNVADRPMLTITYRAGGGSNLLAAGSLAAEAPGPTGSQLAELSAAAVERWQTQAGLPDDQVQLLKDAAIEVVDLSGQQLGRAESGRILIDVNAAGFGWFVDSTPLDDEEFGPDGRAAVNSPAYGRIDLLTLLMHEQGHLLGFGHREEGVLQPTLSAGTRHAELPDWHAQELADVDDVFSRWSELELERSV